MALRTGPAGWSGPALIRRIDVLLRIREAEGEWVEVSTHGSGSSARFAAMKWKRHCVATRWDAFEWKTHYETVLGRFVGTRIVPAMRPLQGSRN